MSIDLGVAEQAVSYLKPRIAVIGVGGGGGNAVNNMISQKLEGVDFIVANTDAQALAHSLAPKKIQLGLNITQGLGAGARPEIGKMAAEEAKDEIANALDGVNMVFITAGMGGGTGSGAAPIVANIAKSKGILTVGVVTKPFSFEGKKRMEIADNSLENFIKEVDSIIVIQNQNLFNVATENTTLPEAFKMADNVLYSGVRSITDLMMMPGLINLDFADVKNIMEDKGKAIMGTGEAEGKGRAKEAANQALSNPLLDECSLHGAKGVLINITGSKDITLPELDEAANIIKEEVGDDANIIFGSSYDDNLQGKIRVSIVVTGINGNDERKPEPVKVAQPQPSLIEQSYDDLTVVPTVNVEPENSFTSSLDLENPFELDETFSDDPLPDDEADVTKFADDDFATLDKSDELPEVPQASALFNAIRNSDGKTEETEQAIEELSSAALQDDFFSSKTDIENTNDDDLVLFTDNDTSIFKDTPLTTDTEEKAEPVAEVHEEESKPNFFSRIGFGSRKKNREEAENNNDEHLVAEKTGTDDEFDLSAEELDIPAFLRR
ncbi:MAG: cell division protein FtsZ [Alphaproteobacteria bacterium]|nr:cell division protein FtsZ [Alphaproteobacteria bacterium]